MDDYFASVIFRLTKIRKADSQDREAILEAADSLIDNLSHEKRKLKRELSDIDRKLEKAKVYKRESSHRYLITNSYLDSIKKDSLDFSKLFLIFVFGSVLGVVIELIWCFIRHGHFESRQGLVFGPFNPLYGFATVLLTVLLHRFRYRSWYYSFIISFFAGSVLEYVLSFAQEKLFGSVSWDYSALSLNINGRVSLLYSLFWGVLGLLWIRLVYPHLAYFISMIPYTVKRYAVIVLFIFMLLNSVISLAAVYRWSERIDGSDNSNRVGIILDRYFPDERMKRIYPNMVWEE